jgi:hypothetical protein
MSERLLYQRSKDDIQISQTIHKDVLQVLQSMETDVSKKRNFITKEKK